MGNGYGSISNISIQIKMNYISGCVLWQDADIRKEAYTVPVNLLPHNSWFGLYSGHLYLEKSHESHENHYHTGQKAATQEAASQEACTSPCTRMHDSHPALHCMRSVPDKEVVCQPASSRQNILPATCQAVALIRR